MLAPGPLAPCLAEPGQGDSLLRVVVPPVVHLMNIKIMYLQMEKPDSLMPVGLGFFFFFCLLHTSF